MGRMPKGPERVFLGEEYEYEVDASLAACCLRMRLLKEGKQLAAGKLEQGAAAHEVCIQRSSSVGWEDPAKPRLKRAGPNPWGQGLPSV